MGSKHSIVLVTNGNKEILNLSLSMLYLIQFDLSGTGPRSAAHGDGREGSHPGRRKIRLRFPWEVMVPCPVAWSLLDNVMIHPYVLHTGITPSEAGNVCVCACARVRACVCVCVCVRDTHTVQAAWLRPHSPPTHTHTHTSRWSNQSLGVSRRE